MSWTVCSSLCDVDDAIALSAARPGPEDPMVDLERSLLRVRACADLMRQGRRHLEREAEPVGVQGAVEADRGVAVGLPERVIDVGDGGVQVLERSSESLTYRSGDATIRVGERLPTALDAMRFNPFNCGGGLRSIGVLNRLRDYACPLSQHGWTARRRTGRRARGQAEPA